MNKCTNRDISNYILSTAGLLLDYAFRASKLKTSPLLSTSTFYDNPSMVMITCRAQREQTHTFLKRVQII